jgi:FkbM family methyltransferase
MAIQKVAEPDPPGVAEIMGEFAGLLAFDVGANVGQSALVLSAQFEKVWSMEPAVESFEHLAEVADGLPNVFPLRLAASDADGVRAFTVQKNHIARGQVTTFVDSVPDGHAWGDLVGYRDLECIRLDTLAKYVGYPDFVKCDVEGHEVHVFRGAVEVLERKPKLFVEVHNAELGAELETMFRPVYGDRLTRVTHPHYRPNDWGYENHFWWVVR